MANKWMKSLLFLLHISVVLSMSHITGYGAKLFVENGTQWFVKGTVYGPYLNASVAYDEKDGAIAAVWPIVDIFTNTSQCVLDAALMAQLGINVIRLERLNATLNHKGCVEAFARQGIYTFISLNAGTVDNVGVMTQGVSTDASSAYVWNSTIYQEFQLLIDEFAQYNSTAGFFVHWWNKWSYQPADGTIALTRASIADVKTYISQKGYRPLLVGIDTDSPILWEYLVCYEADDPHCPIIDFLGIITSAADIALGEAMVGKLVNYSVPFFYSSVLPNLELAEGNPWGPLDDVFGLPNSDLGSTLISGAVCGWWWVNSGLSNNAAAGNLVGYGNDTYVDPGNVTSIVATMSTAEAFTFDYTYAIGTPTALPLFSSLSVQWKTLQPTGIEACKYTPSLVAPTCSSWSIASVTLASYISTYTSTSGTSSVTSISTTVFTSRTALETRSSIYVSVTYLATIITSDESSFIFDYTVPPPRNLPTLVNATSKAKATQTYTVSCLHRPSKTTLSTGPIAGIVVGVFALLCILLAALFLIRKRRRLQAQTPEFAVPQTKDGISRHTEHKAELDTISSNPSPMLKRVDLIPNEWDARDNEEEAHEMFVEPVELDGAVYPKELPEQHGVSEIANPEMTERDKGSGFRRKPVPGSLTEEVDDS